MLGVFFNVGPDPNPLLDKLLLSAPAVAGQTFTGGEANPADLLPETSSALATIMSVPLHLRWLADDPGLHRGCALGSHD